MDLGGREEEVAGGWRELPNEELHLFLSPNIMEIKSRKVAHAVGNRERKKPLGRHQRRRR